MDKRAEISALTGLRAVAALLVFTYHFCGDDSTQPGFGHFPLAFAQVGWSGVTFFFALSGFLLTAIYFDQFSAGISKASLQTYAIKRVARIYPVYFVLLLLVFAISILAWIFQGAPSPSVLDLISHLTMSHALFWRFRTTILPAAWSLSCEEQFYFLLPFLLRLATGKWRWALLLSPVLFLLFGSALSSLIERYGLLPDWKNMSIFGQFPTFFMGGVLGWQFRARVRFSMPLSPFLSLGCWAGAFALYTIGAWVYRERVTWMHGLEGQLLFGFSSLAAIAGCLGGSLPSRILGSTLFVYAGRVSYGFYLCHLPVMFGLKKIGSQTRTLDFFVSVALACALYELVEKPAQRKILALWKRHKQLA